MRLTSLAIAVVSGAVIVAYTVVNNVPPQPFDLNPVSIPTDHLMTIGVLAASPEDNAQSSSSRTGDQGPALEGDAAVHGAAAVNYSFVRHYVDQYYGGSGKPGWVRVGDMDGDGDRDLVAGGGRALFIYENDGTPNASNWPRYGTLDGAGDIGANGGELYDVDGDSDLDVLSAQYYGQIGWWENPGWSPANNPNTAWAFHVLSDESWFLHDIVRVDIDGDGLAQEFIANLNNKYWDTDLTIKWYKPGADPKQAWQATTIGSRRPETAHGHAGLDLADIDGDGDKDLSFANGWYESPGNPNSAWTWHQITNIYGISNSLVRDVDRDGDSDIVVTAGHHGQGAFWFENTDAPGAAFVQHNISAVSGNLTQRHYYDASADVLHHPECLQTADLDGDGDQDVVTCDLYFGEDAGEPGWNEEKASVYVYENVNNGASWEKHTIAPNSYPSHLLQLVDVDQDGDQDIVSESTGYSVVSYYQNTTQSAMPTPTPTSTSTTTPAPSDNTVTPTPSQTLTSIPEDTTTPHPTDYHTPTENAVGTETPAPTQALTPTPTASAVGVETPAPTETEIPEVAETPASVTILYLPAVTSAARTNANARRSWSEALD